MKHTYKCNCTHDLLHSEGSREYSRLSSLLAAKGVSGERGDVCIRRLERGQNQKISTIFLLILNYLTLQMVIQSS